MVCIKKLLLGVMVLSVLGCGYFRDESGGSNDDRIYEDEKLGCVQGVVLNGLTGERLALTGSDSSNTVEVFARNKVLSANVHVNGEDENAPERLKGEYYLCGVPMDNAFPLFARAEGYQNFESVIEIPSTLGQRTPGSQGDDHNIDFPTLLANIRLYPLGTESQDLSFRIVYGGEPVEGATVQLKSTGANKIFAGRDGALAPQIRLVPTGMKTNKNGVVTFPGGNLVLGGAYEYIVIPPEAGRDLAVQSGNVQVGLRASGTSLVQDTYDVTVKLGDSSPTLTQIASTLESPTFLDKGRVILWFNQNIELAPGSDDDYSASLSGATKAKLFAAGTDESMKVKISGNRMELTPVWKTDPKSADEPNLKVNYSGIVIRIVGDKRKSGYKTISASAPVFDN